MSPSRGGTPKDADQGVGSRASLYEDSALEDIAASLQDLIMQGVIEGGAVAASMLATAPLERVKVNQNKVPGRIVMQEVV